MDWMDGLLGGQGISWMASPKELQSTAQCPNGNQERGVSLQGPCCDKHSSIS